ncbi:MAG: adenine phosphoribosyltransferase [Campylobacter sputorum]|uniref:adenine phosphoribosyltransferase n=1 Tax=Campylobacter sputorum TaxID=206 RepID=UPI000B776E19|nr:adenine phosphoribosyltransferase [Campylobacter sputorum]ASM38287.1 adenine phosphoribosyltransferase [Campylobacter sputorum bv. paraureolyticus LMG 11764]MDY6120962.1 adenine phosphoribosyltransferase [Campylobacter sputorum]
MKDLDKKSKQYLLDSIRDVKDFPKPGVIFKDITTLLNNKDAFNLLLDHLSSRYNDKNIDFIAGIESRGFIFAAALCARLKIGFVPIRKPKKLPYMTISQKYSLEYGVDEIEIHVDAFGGIKNARVLLIDDLIATGGTAKASVDLIKQAGGSCIEACFLIDLLDLGGSEDLKNMVNVYSVLEV